MYRCYNFVRAFGVVSLLIFLVIICNMEYNAISADAEKPQDERKKIQERQ